MFGYFLNKPYPYINNYKRDFISYLLIGVFVAVFLIVFQPFEINIWVTDHKMAKLIGFGLISFIIPSLLRILIQFLISEKTREERWTVYREIFTILIVLVSIALCNLLYGRVLSIIPFNLSAFVMAFACTFLVGIFPVSLHVILKHNRLLRLNLQQSDVLNHELEDQQNPVEKKDKVGTLLTSLPGENELCLIAENGKDSVRVAVHDLLFIESADNYSNIVCIEKGGSKKQLLRSSLKRLEAQIPSPAIMRCHRAYIVNLHKIKKVEGNAAGYRLFLFDYDDTIFVSRNYIPLLNERLKKLG